MNLLAVALLSLVLSSGCGAGDAVESAPAATPAHLLAAVAHPDRPEADRARDGDRRPAEVMAFFGIAPGMKVAELMSVRGYYAELLGHAVGSDGVVYVQNNRFVLERFGDDELTARMAGPDLGHLVRWDRELDALQLPPGQLDAVLMVLFYHDTYWQEVDRAAMNARVLAALKPGGIFGVIDHFAADGSGDAVVKSLHRGDAEQIKAEIVAAGFEFDAESSLLRHPEDDRTRNVFDASIRGKTDRFVYRFRKPAR